MAAASSFVLRSSIPIRIVGVAFMATGVLIVGLVLFRVWAPDTMLIRLLVGCLFLILPAAIRDVGRFIVRPTVQIDGDEIHVYERGVSHRFDRSRLINAELVRKGLVYHLELSVRSGRTFRPTVQIKNDKHRHAVMAQLLSLIADE